MNCSSIVELAEHIVELKNMGISVCIFMGAGVSSSAGVPSVNTIMKDIEEKYPYAVMRAQKNRTYGEYMRCLKPGVRKEILKQYMEEPQVNIAHLYLGSFVKKGYVDRIITTNFDSLAIKALGLNNIYPSIYDMAETRKFKANEIIDPSIFYIHGRYNGYYVLNTPEELQIHSDAIRQLFEDTTKKRCWIIIGYSGENDPLFEQFSRIEDYTYGLFWIGNKDHPPKRNALDFLESRSDETSYISGYDADNFFIHLANKLNINPPEILSDPLRYLKDSLSLVSPISKDTELIDMAMSSIKAIENIEIEIKNRKTTDISLIQKTRYIWVFEQYNEIDCIIEDVLKSKSIEVKKNMIASLEGALLFHGDKPRYRVWLDKLKSQIKIDDPPGYIDEFELSDIVKEQLTIAKMKYYNADEILTDLGLIEARKLFGDYSIIFYGKRLYGSDLARPYIYRMYTKAEYFSLIREEYLANPKINIVNELAKKLQMDIDYTKTHLFLPALVGDDAELLHENVNRSAIIHLQITYGIKNQNRYPLELLVGKYTNSIGVAGFVTDYKAHDSLSYSRLTDNTLRDDYKKEMLKKNNIYYYPFFSFEKYFQHLYSYNLSPLLRVMIVTEEQCNYRCAFCCFLDNEQKSDDYVDMGTVDIDNQFLFLLQCAHSAGYKRVMFTGGEPLLLDIDKMQKMIRAVSGAKLFDDFWITTNGSLLTEEVIDKLVTSGLRKIVVSISAETEGKYSEYTKSGMLLSSVLLNVKTAIVKGLKVRIDVPINTLGIQNYCELMELVDLLRPIGVKELCYFEIHKSAANSRRFKDLYLDSDQITMNLFYSDNWTLNNIDGKACFINNDFKIFIPTLPSHSGYNCKKNNCGSYCQGNYASYLLMNRKGFTIRACHREFSDGRNEFFVPYRNVKPDFEDDVIKAFEEAINYAK